MAYIRWVKVAGNAERPEVHLMTIDGQSDRVLAQPGMASDWSADGRRLLYLGESGLRVFDTDRGQSWSIAGTADD